MRINGTGSAARAGSKPAVKGARGGGPAFNIGQAGAARSSAPPRAPQSIQNIDSILAIQSVGDALAGRKKAVRRGNQMLDLLDELRTDLLGGCVSAGKLQRLAKIVEEKAGDPQSDELAQVLEEIELRARVELAKHGQS